MSNDNVVLTGIKPTGIPHLGNYLGAIRPALRLADKPGAEAYFFVADYHALNVIQDAKLLSSLVHEVAVTWLSCGLDPDRVTFFRQSDIPEVFELQWALGSLTPKGWMNKAHAYKAAVASNREAEKDDDDGVSFGLFAYPVLMAADILAFDTAFVPVGQDQVQHVEIARDIALRVNNTYRKELVRVPAALVEDKVKAIPGLDGRKMSKSYDNTVPLFSPPNKMKKLIARIVTDSSGVDDPKDPETSSIFAIYREFATPEETAALADRYRAGIAWGHAKQALAELLIERLAPARERYEKLMADPALVDRLLLAGAEKARVRARVVLDRLRRGIGVVR